VAVVVGFHCDVISCELAWRGAQRVARTMPAAATEFGARGHRNMVGVTSILDRGQVLGRIACIQCIDAAHCYRCRTSVRMSVR